MTIIEKEEKKDLMRVFKHRLASEGIIVYIKDIEDIDQKKDFDDNLNEFTYYIVTFKNNTKMILTTFRKKESGMPINIELDYITNGEQFNIFTHTI